MLAKSQSEKSIYTYFSTDLCLLCEQLPPPLRPVEIGTSLSTASLLLRYLLACSSTTLPQAPRMLLMKDGLVCLSLKQEV
jgi:hypothetical protein